MVKLKMVNGAVEFRVSLPYEAYETTTGIVEVPDEVAVWAAGTGLFEVVLAEPEPEPKPRGKRPAVAEPDRPAEEEN